MRASKPPLSTCRRVTLFTVGLLECCIFGGLVFGWPQLVLVLKQEGIYANLCHTVCSLPQDDNATFHNDALLKNGKEANMINVGNLTDLKNSDYQSKGDRFDDSYRINLDIQTTASISYENLSQSEQWGQWKNKQCSAQEDQDGDAHVPEDFVSCPEQDERLALIFTVSVVCYSLPSVLIGYMLHYAGLWATRILSSLMVISSFVFLGLVSTEQPDFLFPAMILLATGGNQLRLCAVQLGDLFPSFRATAITVLMGAYSASSSIFYLFQVTSDAGWSRSVLCWVLAGLATASLLATFLMPVRHVSEHLTPADSKANDTSPAASPPLSSSLWSLSSLLHQYWFFTALFILNSYQQTFNLWVTASSCTADEVRNYTAFFSFCGIAGAVVAPVLGHITDCIVRRAKKGTHDQSSIDFRVKEIRANFIPLLVTSICSTGMYACLMFFNGVSIYFSLICLIVCRSCIFSTSTAFLRVRFPAEHLDRLLGIYSTVVSLLLLVVYPHFVWSMNQYYSAIIFAIVINALNISYPLHLLYEKGLYKSISGMIQPNSSQCNKYSPGNKSSPPTLIKVSLGLPSDSTINEEELGPLTSST